MPKLKNNKPIGIFDSGIGGLTVLKQIEKFLPQESYIYVADNLNKPFGDKSESEILKINDQIIRYLISKQVKLIIIACNTSSALALKHNQECYTVPFIDMLNSGLGFAHDLPSSTKVGVMATQATVYSKAYEKVLLKFNPDLVITQQACPKLVPLIENQMYEEKTLSNSESNTNLKQAVSQYTKLIKNSEIVVFGCSHYPYARNIIQEELPNCQLVDPAEFVAQATYNTLTEIGYADQSNLFSRQFYYTKEESMLLANAKSFQFNEYCLIDLNIHSY